MNEPLVSVIVLTFNHEAFIEDCLNGILNQTYSNFEVIISDDHSEDGTFTVISQLATGDDRIKVYKTEKNLGPAGNFQFALSKSKGELISICEGDDVWTNSLKLRLQVDEFRADQSTYLAYANYCRIDAGGEILEASVLEGQPESFALGDLINNHGPATNSIMLRRNALPTELPESFFSVLNPDVFIIGFALKSGKAKYIDQVLSAHRSHESGIWSSKDKFERGLHKYSTLVQLFKELKEKELARQTLYLFERQVILAKENRNENFNRFFSELPIRRRLLLRLKWRYRRLKR